MCVPTCTVRLSPGGLILIHHGFCSCQHKDIDPLVSPDAFDSSYRKIHIPATFVSEMAHFMASMG